MKFQNAHTDFATVIASRLEGDVVVYKKGKVAIYDAIKCTWNFDASEDVGLHSCARDELHKAFRELDPEGCDVVAAKYWLRRAQEMRAAGTLRGNVIVIDPALCDWRMSSSGCCARRSPKGTCFSGPDRPRSSCMFSKSGMYSKLKR